ncbi:MAG: Holliday junction resolvase RuvX [Pseudomonadota bacterium]
MTPPATETVLGFDFGLRRIGVAVATRQFGQASAVETLVCPPTGPDYEAIGRLIREWRPARLVVGSPLSLDGSENDMSRAADKFARKLAHEFNLPIERVDERHSSVEAEDMIRRARRSGRKRRARAADVDKLAAQVILQSWLNQHPPEHDYAAPD